MKMNERGEIMKNKKGNSGLMVLIICGLLAVAIMVACVFFPEQIFGFLK